MIRGRGTVTYEDGRTEGFTMYPVDIARYERWAIKRGMPPALDAASTNAALFIAHSAVHRGQPVELAFDQWAETVTDIDLDVQPVTPTEPGASDA